MTSRAPPSDLLPLLLSALSVAWLAASLAPVGLPGWPAVSLGLSAIVCAAAPGRALPRGTAAFLGLCGAVGGASQIALFWGLSAALS